MVWRLLSTSALLQWLAYGELDRQKLALLVLCALAIHALANQLRWRLFGLGTGGRSVKAVGGSWAGKTLAGLVRTLYYLGIPGAVLWRGALLSQVGLPSTYTGDQLGDAILRTLSMAGMQDARLVGSGITLGVGTLGLLTALWVWYVRTATETWSLPIDIPWWKALREASFMQALWALYRGVVSAWSAERMQVAVISLGLITAVWLLDPQRRHDLFTPRGYLVVLEWTCALFTAVISMVLPVLWVLVLMHTLWIWVSGRLLMRLWRASWDPAFDRGAG